MLQENDTSKSVLKLLSFGIDFGRGKNAKSQFINQNASVDAIFLVTDCFASARKNTPKMKKEILKILFEQAVLLIKEKLFKKKEKSA